MPKPFITPPALPDGEVCRTMKIPNSKEWLGIFNSALLEMVNQYNYEQVNPTDLTIEETIAVCQTIIEDYWATEGCGIGESCLQPDGARVLRLNALGHFEELADGVWQPPTGDYAVPAVPSRGEPTPYSRRCAAAANAANVLAMLYEEVSDMVGDGLTDAEIVAALVIILISAIGLWLALAVGAILGLLWGLFVSFVEIARYMTADLWGSEFTQLLTCALFNCSSDDGTVVTFDFQCVREQLTDGVDLTSIDAETQLRLFGQVDFILHIIGVDGLNAAGATTAVTVFDCVDCGDWCYEFDFTTGEHGWEVPSVYASAVHYVSGEGFKPIDYGITAARRDFGIPVNIVTIGMEWSSPMTGNYQRLFYSFDGAIGSPQTVEAAVGTLTTWSFDINATHESVDILLQNGTPNSSYPLDFALARVVIYGNGENPFGEPNCGEEE